MENWITSAVEQYSYFGVFLLILIENLFPPIPSEVILTFGGFLTTDGNAIITPPLNYWGVVAFSTLGSVGGAIILFGIGRLLTFDRLVVWVEKYGKYIQLKVSDIHKTDAWFKKYGNYSVFFGRFIPVIRSLISVPAGMGKMNFPLFLILTTIGSLIWNVLLISLGVFVGKKWRDIVLFFDTYSNYVQIGLVVIVAGVIAWLIRRWLSSSKK